MIFREGYSPMKFHRTLHLITLLLLTLGSGLHFLGYSMAAQEVVNGGVEGVKNPQVLHGAKRAYTEKARRAGIEGIVLLQVVVRKDGTANSFKVLKKL